MNHVPSTVTLGIAATGLVVMLSGCSLFQRVSTDEPQPVPTAVQSVVAAPSGAASAKPSTSAQSSATKPVRTPIAPVAAPKPPTVAGYVLKDSDQAVHRRFQSVAGQFRGVFSGLTSRTVAKSGQDVGSLVLLGLQPGLVGNTQVEERLVPGMVKGMSGQGAEVTTRVIEGQKVAVAKTKSTNIVAWYRSGTVVLVLGNGTDPTQSLDFTRAYLAAR